MSVRTMLKCVSAASLKECSPLEIRIKSAGAQSGDSLIEGEEKT